MDKKYKTIEILSFSLLLVLLILIIQIFKSSSADEKFYLSEDKKCKEMFSQGQVPDPETSTFVRSDFAIYDQRLNSCLYVIGVSYSGNQLATGNTTVRIYNQTTGEDIKTFEVNKFYVTQNELTDFLKHELKAL